MAANTTPTSPELKITSFRLGFVRKRRQSDGRSFWLQVTNKFHQHFEIEDLPAFNQTVTKSKQTGEADETSGETGIGDSTDLPPEEAVEPGEDALASTEATS